MDSPDIKINNFSIPFTTGFFTKAFRLFAILFIIGCLLPTITPSYKGNHLSFVNIDLFVSEGVNFWVRIGAIYPLLAGTAILYLVSRKKVGQFQKAIAVMVLSLFAVLFFKSDFFDIINSGIIRGSIFQSSLFILGVTFILISGLLIWVGNLSLTPKIIGAAGSIFFFLYLIIPIQTGGALFGERQPTIGYFFDMLGMSGSEGGAANIMGLCLVISSGFLIASSVYIVLLFRPKYSEDTFGKKITLYWIWSQAAIIIGLVYSLISSFFSFSSFAMMLLVTIKIVFLLYGMIFLTALSTFYFMLLLSPIEKEEEERPKRKKYLYHL